MKFSLILVVVIWFDCAMCRYSKASRRSNATPKESKTVEYFTNPTQEITIPVMIHLDKVLTRNLTSNYNIKTKKIAKNLFTSLLKNVEKLFRHPSLNQTVHFVLLDVKMLKNVTSKLKMDENVSKYLNSYCQWQGERKIPKRKWYYSVLFSGLDLFYLDKNQREVRSSTGRGYMRSICSVRNSCSLLEWHFDNLAYILAHEIAHSLGMSHDGVPHSQCRGHRYIMDAKYNPRRPAANWSPCNKRALEHFLKSRQSWCLRPESRNTILV